MEDSKTANYEDYRKSDWYDGAAVEALNRQLEGYTTDYDTLKKQAEAEYAPTYKMESDALQSRLDSQKAAAQNEQAALGRRYERQRELTNERYDQSAAKLNNALNARGLGRSSLTATQGAYLEGQRNRALEDLDRAEADDIAAINSRIAQLTEETARSHQTMASNYAQQLEKRINDLRSGNQSAAVSLQLQIAALQRQGYEAYQGWLLKQRAQELDEEEFRQKYGLNETPAAASGYPKPAAAQTPQKKTADSEKKNTLAELIRGAAEGIRSAAGGITGLFAKSAKTGQKATKSAPVSKAADRLGSVKVKQL